MNVLVKMKDGTEFLTPVENLDNIKRMLAGKYNDLEFPDWKAEDEEEETEEVEGKKKPGRKPKATN